MKLEAKKSAGVSDRLRQSGVRIGASARLSKGTSRFGYLQYGIAIPTPSPPPPPRRGNHHPKRYISLPLFGTKKSILYLTHRLATTGSNTVHDSDTRCPSHY